MFEPERFRSAEYLGVLDHAESAQACVAGATVIEAMTDAAEAGYPHEICGLLIGGYGEDGWRIDEARQVENINAERAADRFQLDPAAYQAVDRELRGSGREIIGVFHSHPDCPAKPSPTDLENAWESFLYPIISVCDGKVADIAHWTLNDDGNKFRKVKQATDA